MEEPSIKKNYIFNLVLQILFLIIPIITTPYTSRVLGADKIGDYSYYTSMVTYFSILAILGTSLYGQRQIAYNKNDIEKRSQDFWNTVAFRAITSVISLALYFGYMIIFDTFNVVCLILSYNILNVIIDITWFYQGMESFKTITFRNLFVKIVCTILIFVFVKEQNDLWIYVLIQGASTIVCGLILWPSLRKYVTFVKHVHPFNNFKDILLVFLPTIAIQVYTVLDKSMIGWITNSSYQNGCYDRAETIAKMCLTIVTAAGAVVLPRIANLHKNGNIEETKVYLYKTYRFIFFLAIPITFGLIAVSDKFIPIFLGEGYDDAILLLKIFAPLVLFIGTAYITGYTFLISINKQNIYTVSVTIAALLNLIMNLILINFIGAIGAAISTLFAEAFGCIFQIVYCCKKKLLNLKEIFIPSWKYLISGLVMFAVVIIENYFFNVSIIYLIIMVFSGIFTYGLFVLLLRDSFVVSQFNNVFSTLKSQIFKRGEKQ